MDNALTEVDRFVAQWRDEAPTVTAHTSGSTGVPKPVELSKADMRQSALATLRFFGMAGRRGLTFALPLSADYIAGKMMIVRALEADARLIAVSPSRQPLAGIDPGVHIDMIPIVPAQIDGLLADPTRGRVDVVLVGGAPMTPAQESALVAAGVNAWATYGMTETCSHVALRRVGEKRFRPLPGISFSLGCGDTLVISRDAASWSPVATHDVVDLADDGFVWLGRSDNVINSGGVKVHPEQVEKAIEPVMAAVTAEFYVTSRRSAQWGDEVIVKALGSPRDNSTLLEAMRSLVGKAARPKDIVWVDEFAYTSTGKLRRL